MPITVLMRERRAATGGTFYEVGQQYTLDDATARMFMQYGFASYVSGNLAPNSINSNQRIDASRNSQVDDNGCAFFARNTSPIQYTVNVGHIKEPIFFTQMTSGGTVEALAGSGMTLSGATKITSAQYQKLALIPTDLPNEVLVVVG